MKMLLLKDVRKLGYVGDVVTVRPGYARNYLLPEGLATEPTDENIAAIDEEKKRAAAERAARLKQYQLIAEKLADVSVTIEASANPEGTLYGSVSARDVAQALKEQGHPVEAEFVLLDPPIRSLDNRMVRIEFTDEVTAEVKVWVVREGGAIEDGDEAAADDSGTDDADVEYDGAVE